MGTNTSQNLSSRFVIQERWNARISDCSPAKRRMLRKIQFRIAKVRGHGVSGTWRLPAEAAIVQAQWDQRKLERDTAAALGATKRQGRL